MKWQEDKVAFILHTRTNIFHPGSVEKWGRREGRRDGPLRDKAQQQIRLPPFRALSAHFRAIEETIDRSGWTRSQLLGWLVPNKDSVTKVLGMQPDEFL